MFANLRNFVSNEAGAVTVDWIVLTAAVVGLATTAWIATRNGTLAAADIVQNGIVSTPVSNN